MPCYNTEHIFSLPRDVMTAIGPKAGNTTYSCLAKLLIIEYGNIPGHDSQALTKEAEQRYWGKQAEDGGALHELPAGRVRNGEPGSEMTMKAKKKGGAIILHRADSPEEYYE